MKALDKYIAREIAIPLGVAMGLFFVVIAIGQLVKISDATTGIGVSSTTLLQALLYSLPPLLGVLIPVSIFFAVLFAVGRLSSDREITALYSGGVSPMRLLRVPALFGVLGGLACAWALLEGEAWGIGRLKQLMSRGAQKELAQGVRPGTFNAWVDGVMFYAGGRNDEGLEDVIFADRRDPQQPLVMSAQRGEVLLGSSTGNLVFDLYDGKILTRDTKTHAFRVIEFEKSRYRLDVHRLTKRKIKTAATYQGLTISELLEEAEGETRPRRRTRILNVLHRRFALPVATLLFALIAVPLGASPTGAARARGFLYSAAIVGAYYYTGRLGVLQAYGGKIEPWLAAWVPNGVGAAFMAWLLWRFFRRGSIGG